MLKRNAVMGVVLALGLFSSAVTQQNPDDGRPNVEAMKKIDFMLGEWHGTGWIQMGQQRTTFNVTEMIQLKAGGTVIALEGIGKDATTGKVGHNAYGVISYDPEKKSYSVHSYVMNGQSGIFPMAVGTRGIDWEIKTDKQYIKYGINIDEKGQWVEKGSVRIGEDRWFQFMEMTLKKG